MAWKKICDSSDCISYEKRKKGLSIRLEGSPNKGGRWNVYRVYYDGKGLNHVEEHEAKNKDEALSLIKQLKEERELSLSEVKKINNAKEVAIRFRRIHNEENFEKWHFSVDAEPAQNVVWVTFSDQIRLDIIIHEKYRPYERKIMSRIVDTLGLRDGFDSMLWDIYYFSSKRSDRTQRDKKENIVVGRIEFEIARDDEEEI